MKRYFKRIYITGIVLGSLLIISAIKATETPNVVLIIGDDISWNDLGCYGHPNVRTPNIDRLAKRGLRFDSAFLTTSSCSPSRLSIITGRYPHNTGAAELHSPLPAGQVTFVQKLHEAGYWCAQGGKWHMAGAETGFDERRAPNRKSDPGGEKMWVPLLQERPQDRPFFMWFASNDAHRPWDNQIRLEKHLPAEVPVPAYLADAPATREDLARYYDEIARLDDFVGKVMAELEKQNVSDNTLVIFMADNGRAFPRSKTRVYDSGMKTPLVMHWPEKIRPGLVCDSLVSAIDLAPTILEACGVQAGATFQGRSFLSLFQSPEQLFRNYVFAEHNWHDYEALERMVRTKDYLYVLNERPQFPNGGPADSGGSPAQADLNALFEKGELSPEQMDTFLAPRPREELFDVRDDPEQFHNLVGDPEVSPVLEDMRKLLGQWREETGDTTPENLSKDVSFPFSSELRPGVKRYNDVARGEMPGSASNATSINHRGPF